MKAANRVNVRTTPEEIAKYRTIKETLSIYRAKVNEASEALKAAYKAENRPMCGTLDTPGMFAPKSPAIKLADANYNKAVEVFRKVILSLGGAKMQTRLHRLEMAGVI